MGGRPAVLRSVGAYVLLVVLAFGGARVVALPERCGPVSADQRLAAAQATVDWFARTQADDGTFLYRLDATTGERLTGYSWVRHAGVLFSLEQAAGAGLESAAATADRGWRALERQIVRWGDRAGVRDGSSVSAGGTALATVALAQRRLDTASAADDDLLRAFGRELVSLVRDDGTVAEVAEVETGVGREGSVGRFTTGEVAFALARLDRVFPSEEWAARVPTITHYLAFDKAAAEGFVPDMADHWAAYALAEVLVAGGSLTSWERDWARDQMGLASVMIRYESQRSNEGIDRWLRGRTSVGSAVGTHGESMQGWARVAALEPALSGQVQGTRALLACNSAVIVERQVSSTEAAETPDPEATAGTWLWFGVTQMDDQQHSLSALLGARSVLDDPDAGGSAAFPRRTPTPSSWLLAVLVVALAVDPARLGRRTSELDGRSVAAGSVLGVSVLSVLAALGGSIATVLDASSATLVIAAAAVMAVGALVAVLAGQSRSATVSGRPWLMPVLIPSTLRPAAMVLAIALGAAGRWWAVPVAGALAVLTALGVRAITLRNDSVARWSEHVVSAVAIVAAVALLVDGVYAL